MSASAAVEGTKDYFNISLLKTTDKNKTIELKDQEFKHGSLGNYKFPSKKILLTNFANYTYDNYCYLKGYTPLGESVTVYVPQNFQVKYSDEPVVFSDKTKVLMDLPTFSIISVTIGSDPEIFVTDKDDKLIPAPSFLGSKEKPSKYSGKPGSYNDYGKTCYYDGFQAEFTTWNGSCLGYLIDALHCGLKGVLKAARDKYPDAKLSLKPVMVIPRDMLDSAADDVVEFGCMPSKNAYGLKVDIPPGRQVLFRSAGGHLHFGLSGGARSDEESVKMVKSLDAILGVACVALFNNIDDPRRRQYYGLPGEYRTPKHGLEYRPLSNAWLSHPLITNLVYDLGRKALGLGANNFRDKVWEASEEEVISCMIESDVEKARSILSRNKETMLALLHCAYPYFSASSNEVLALYNAFYNGMDSILKDPYDIEGNWHLTDDNFIWHGGSAHKKEMNVANNAKNLFEGMKL